MVLVEQSNHHVPGVVVEVIGASVVSAKQEKHI